MCFLNAKKRETNKVTEQICALVCWTSVPIWLRSVYSVVQVRQNVVEVPLVTVKEQLVEVPVPQVMDLIREVPRPELQQVEKQVYAQCGCCPAETSLEPIPPNVYNPSACRAARTSPRPTVTRLSSVPFW
eukprot:4569387-Amphidinium_carterae.2